MPVLPPHPPDGVNPMPGVRMDVATGPWRLSRANRRIGPATRLTIRCHYPSPQHASHQRRPDPEAARVTKTHARGGGRRRKASSGKKGFIPPLH